MKGGLPLAILVNLDVMMAKRKVSAGELSERVGITPANLSILKNNKANPLFYPGDDLPGPGLPACGYPGVPAR